MESTTSHCFSLYEQFSQRLKQALVLPESGLIRHLFIAWFSKGHVLIEGPPGTGKTKSALHFSQLLGRTFKRIQFTSDMLPADILGSNIYSPKENSFSFLEGPIFSDIILADEINRAPPRTQSALLEAMEERQVTVEGVTRNLSPEFFVIATQNAIEFEGTFPLPEAQMDRFLFKLKLPHYSHDQELEILKLNLSPSSKVLGEAIEYGYADAISECENVKIAHELFDYVAKILAKTRNHESIEMGASVRAGLNILKSSKVLALLNERDFVTVDDIKELAIPVLRHRLRVTPEASMNGLQVESVVESIINSIEFPK